MELVVNFRAIGDHVSKLIVLEVRVEFLLGHSHELKLTDSSYDS